MTLEENERASSVIQHIKPEGHWDWHIPTPFSQVIKAGRTIYVGGQLSADEKGNVVGQGDIELQTRNVFENITKMLAAAGATWRNVVKLNTYYVFTGDNSEAQAFWEKMTRIRLEYLANPGPVATAVRVAGLMYDGFLVEADVIAVLDE
jgi:2-iminobutanoate/2-iminopropanoate deaminase